MSYQLTEEELKSPGRRRRKGPKLTLEQVREIIFRADYEQTRVLAKEFGVSEGTISSIKHGHTWRILW